MQILQVREELRLTQLASSATGKTKTGADIDEAKVGPLFASLRRGFIGSLVAR